MSLLIRPLVFVWLLACASRLWAAPGALQATVNVMEKNTYPTLESVARVFKERQKPEMMFFGIPHRFNEASLDQIAESGMPFFETRPENLSGIITQILTYGSVSTRILRGEPVRPTSQNLLRRQLSNILETRRVLLVYLQNVPLGKKIMLARGGRIKDVWEQFQLIERDCLLASRTLSESAYATSTLPGEDHNKGG